MRHRIAAAVLRFIAGWYDHGPVETHDGPMVGLRVWGKHDVALSVEYALRQSADAIEARCC